MGRLRGRVDALSSRAESWVERRRREAVPMDLAVSFYERDRDQFASVLGAAVALRLFLFMVPAVLAAVGVLTAVVPQRKVEALIRGTSVTGSVAEEVAKATEASRSAWILLLLGGLWVSIWAGRNLAIVLAACSGAAWRLEASRSRADLRTAGAVTLLAFGIVVCLAVVNRLRASFGLAGVTTSWVVAAAIIGIAWFAVSWTLPRGTPDPGALLPGAVLVGVVLAAIQWFLQYYLPEKVERASAVAGGTGTAVAVLSSMFVIGRVMAARVESLGVV
jgi:uncharacterized BrkB/YihY/UPF0761 family membrane protein